MTDLERRRVIAVPLVNREATKQLRDLIKRSGSTLGIGGILPIQAILAEMAGYELFWIPGGFYHTWYLGVPDSGLWTTTEFVEYARRIASVVRIPIISDLDVGGGNPVNVYRSVKDLIQAGVAGCHIEDVQYPKGVTTSGLNWKPGTHDDERLVTVEEQLGRLGAALEARNELDPNFVIIARTDARGAYRGSLEEAINRGKEYERARVDMIMFDGLRNWGECRTALKSVQLPAFCAGPAVRDPRDELGNVLPLPTVKQRTSDGEKLILIPGLGWQGALQTAWDQLTAFKRDGFEVVDEWRRADAARSLSDRVPQNRHAIEKILALQQNYLPKPQQLAGGDLDSGRR
jgi:2-methylisocitrate lyase-like PEP mutase family enzyme